MKTADQWQDMTFVNRGHLGGFVRSDPDDWPHGDPMTYTPALWDWLAEQYNPKVVWDVGCGEGHFVKHMLGKQCQAWGIDGCVEALETAVVTRECIVIHDFSRGVLNTPEKVQSPDLVYSCEFVEHVEQKYIENFLRIFDLARIVCFTHAFTDQPGHHHVNCQEPDYWISAMEKRGFLWDEESSKQSRHIAGKSHWKRSGLVFVRQE